MAEFPYTPGPNNIERFLAHIQSSGVPNAKVTATSIKSFGFTSSNDRYIPSVLKSLGFLNSDGMPTDSWRGYKDKSKARQIIADAVRVTYTGLFSAYSDAYRKDDEALHNYFAGESGLASATVDLMVRTFKILCGKADFEAVAPVATKTPPVGPAAPASSAAQPKSSTAPVPSVNINIELHLPPTDDASVYDNLFAAMKKHLFR